MTQQPWGQQPEQRPAGQPAWGQQQQQPWGQAQPGWGQPVAQRPPGLPPQTPYQGQPVGYPPAPPQGGGGPTKLVLLGIVAVIAVGFFAFSLTSFLGGSGEVAGPTPLPTPGETSGPPEPPSPEPVPTPEVGETSAPPVGVPEPDLNPPDLPVPQTWDEVDAWLTSNALYAESTLVPTNCTLSKIDVTTASPETMQEHLNTLTGCLMMVWQEPMQRAGFIMPRPPITVYTAPITTACGQSSSMNASYCSGDQRMYYSYDIHEAYRRNNPEVIDNAFLPDLVMGHEFGHAMQARSGILLAELYAERYRAANESEELELSRRTEVQADCFAGIFLNSVAQASRMTEADRAGIIELARALGDDSLSGQPGIEGNHGWGVNREHWASTGLASNQVGVCNTFIADPELVR